MRPFVSLFAASILFLGIVVAAHAQDTADAISEAMKKPQPPVEVAGSWNGTDTQSGSDGGSGPMTLDLVQNRQHLTGTFSVTTGNGNPSGSVTGTIKGDAIHATFHATGGTNHPCNAEVAAAVDGNQMTGTFVVHGNKRQCQSSTGTFTLTKQ